MVNFNKAAVINELKHSKPLFFAGQHYGTIQRPDRVGHFWVIDGAYNIIKGIAIETDPVGKNYYRCIWGWGGTANGYYMIDPGIRSSNGYLFEDLKYICNLNKNI